MRVSARLRNLVYPAISRNDNHCGNEGDRALGHVAKQRAALSLASYPTKAGYPVRRGLAIDRNSSGILDHPLARVMTAEWPATTRA